MNTTDLTPLPARPNLEQYKKQAKDFVKVCRSGDSDAIQRIRKYHPRSGQLVDSGILIAEFDLADAQLVIAREHGFESWPKFAKHIEGLAREDSPVSKFESAADAIVTGDHATLEGLLRENPELVRARSTRVHRATLLHYVSANGFENYRQKSPPNAVEIAEILLQAGAEVDAVADMYGKDTTLGLVATSVHPRRARLQIALIETLLDHGAAVDGAPGGCKALAAALANGCPEAAEVLARRGARIDIVGAAGLGRLDLLKSFFKEDGSLKANSTETDMESAFRWACLYGRTLVVDFLLEKGVDLRAGQDTAQTGLHNAVIGGNLDTINLLLARKAPLEAKNVYGGTVLDQALWCSVHGCGGADYLPIVASLIAAGARVDPGWLRADLDPPLEGRMAEMLRRSIAGSQRG